jgi:hypothetical protein
LIHDSNWLIYGIITSRQDKRDGVLYFFLTKPAFSLPLLLDNNPFFRHTNTHDAPLSTNFEKIGFSVRENDDLPMIDGFGLKQPLDAKTGFSATIDQAEAQLFEIRVGNISNGSSSVATDRTSS